METVNALEGTATIPVALLERLRDIERNRTILIKSQGDSGYCSFPSFRVYEYLGEDAVLAKIAKSLTEISAQYYDIGQKRDQLNIDKDKVLDTRLGARLRFLFTGKR
jgi:hypothetical protein